MLAFAPLASPDHSSAALDAPRQSFLSPSPAQPGGQDFSRTLDQRLSAQRDQQRSSARPQAPAAQATTATGQHDASRKAPASEASSASTEHGTAAASEGEDAAVAEASEHGDHQAADSSDQPTEQTTDAPPAAASTAAEFAGLPAALAASQAASGDSSAAAADDDESGESLLLNAQAGGKRKQPGKDTVAGGEGQAALKDGSDTGKTLLRGSDTAAVTSRQSSPHPAAALPQAQAQAQAGDTANASGDNSFEHNLLHATALRQGTTTAATTSTNSLQLPVHTASGRAAWGEEIGTQVRWMLGRAESRAELLLTPASLGKLEVSISLSGDQTTAQFVASTQAARDALEQAMPRLREILEQAGIALGHADVSTSGEGSTAHQQGESGAGHRSDGEAGPASVAAAPSPGSRVHDGLIDTFA